MAIKGWAYSHLDKAIDVATLNQHRRIGLNMAEKSIHNILKQCITAVQNIQRTIGVRLCRFYPLVLRFGKAMGRENEGKGYNWFWPSLGRSLLPGGLDRSLNGPGPKGNRPWAG